MKIVSASRCRIDQQMPANIRPIATDRDDPGLREIDIDDAARVQDVAFVWHGILPFLVDAGNFRLAMLARSKLH